MKRRTYLLPGAYRRHPGVTPGPADGWSRAGLRSVLMIRDAVALRTSRRPSMAATAYLPPAQVIRTAPSMASADLGVGNGTTMVRYPRLPSRRPIAPIPVGQPGSGVSGGGVS